MQIIIKEESNQDRQFIQSGLGYKISSRELLKLITYLTKLETIWKKTILRG